MRPSVTQTNAQTAILPGATIGIFGSGQLGRMMAIPAKQMGYRVHTYSPVSDSPTGQVSDREFCGSYDDADAVSDFIRSVDVVTYEFENVDSSVAEAAERLDVPVHPGGWVLHTAQNRIREKTTLRDFGLPVTPFVAIEHADDLSRVKPTLGFPIVLKTASSGYDGKGQSVLESEEELTSTWQEMGGAFAVAEKLISFQKEVSVVAHRGYTGDYSDYGVIENTHRNHVLDVSMTPSDVSLAVREEATRLTRMVLESLDVVGTLCVEYFLTQNDELLINEIAPRPHNSGHLTIEAAETSQFEQHIRAICGLPLGSVQMRRPAVMLNLLGELWENGTPDWLAALRHTGVKLHLYGKREARPGRKMGHLTVVADELTEALNIGIEARKSLAVDAPG